MERHFYFYFYLIRFSLALNTAVPSPAPLLAAPPPPGFAVSGREFTAYRTQSRPSLPALHTADATADADATAPGHPGGPASPPCLAAEDSAGPAMDPTSSPDSEVRLREERQRGALPANPVSAPHPYRSRLS